MITLERFGRMGRVGNQLFQIAALMGISAKTGQEFFLPSDHLIDYSEGSYSGCYLNHFMEIPSKWFRSGVNTEGWNRFHFFYYTDAAFNQPDNTVFDACFFQSEKYFAHIADEILQAFRFREAVIRKSWSLLSGIRNPVGVHVRRGDYAKTRTLFYMLPPQYYLNAWEKFGNGFTPVVFSDDPRWCRKKFPRNWVTVTANDFESLCAMTMCRHNIISNSTFSWWGAYLNQTPFRRVIMPDKWFNWDTETDSFSDEIAFRDCEKVTFKAPFVGKKQEL